MNPRSRLLTAVVVACVLAAGLGFFLVVRESPEAARLRLLIDVLLLAALAATVFVVTRNPLERREELLDAMRALARGSRDRRLDYESFGDLEDIARTYNEVAAALTEHEDPNLGPIKTKRRQERPAWMETEGGGHPDLGEVRVISKKQKAAQAIDAEERAAKARAKAKVAAEPPEPEPEPEPEVRVGEPQARAKPSGKAKRRAPEPARATPEPPAADERDDDGAEESAAALADAAADNDTAIDGLLSRSSGPDEEPAPDEPAAPEAGELHLDDGEQERALPPFDMRALFREFVDAKRAHDEDTDDLEYDAFAETLEDEMARLLEAHACRAVRFEVRVQDGEVSLLPRLLR